MALLVLNTGWHRRRSGLGQVSWWIARHPRREEGGPVQVWQDARWSTGAHQVVMATRHEAKISAMKGVRA